MATRVASAPATPAPFASKRWGLGLAFLVLVAIMLLPQPNGLPVAGQRMLAVFGFALVIWVTEAIDYAISAVVITALMAILLGTSPDPAKPSTMMDTTRGLTMALGGFASTALALVAAALFLAAAMMVTGLDRRITLTILSRIGARADRIVIGAILVSFAAIDKALAQLGPMTGAEKRLLALSLVLLFFWATEGIAHHYDSSTTTVIAIAILLLPVIGVMDWKKVQPLIPWGTIVLFAVGISLGTTLLQTQAASWLANLVVARFGLNYLPALAILAVMALFLIVIHLGFASATALASAMIPIVIAVLQKVHTPGISVLGMTMVLQYVVSYGFILPVNSPQAMLAYGTETFQVRDFVRTGLVITVLAYLLTLLFGATYWHWLSYV